MGSIFYTVPGAFKNVNRCLDLLHKMFSANFCQKLIRIEKLLFELFEFFVNWSFQSSIWLMIISTEALRRNMTHRISNNHANNECFCRPVFCCHSLNPPAYFPGGKCEKYTCGCQKGWNEFCNFFFVVVVGDIVWIACCIQNKHN